MAEQTPQHPLADAFYTLSVKYEGYVETMYLDVKGLVTVGVGNLLEPASLALDLPFVTKDGRKASRKEIAAEWMRIKAHKDLIHAGWTAFARIAGLRLTRDGVRQLFDRKLSEVRAALTVRFPEISEWPADAQMATLSISWACGAAFHFPKCVAALQAQDFMTAANECRIEETGNPGIVRRNLANKVMFQNAAIVAQNGDSRAVLHWPEALSEGVPTQPEQPSEVTTWTDQSGNGKNATGSVTSESFPPDPPPEGPEAA